MGRTEKSRGLAPPAVRKDIRAKQARQIINKAIPPLLASNSKARKGSESSELVANPGPVDTLPSKLEPEKDEDADYIKRKGQGRRKIKPDRGAEAELQSKNSNGNGKSKGKGRKRQNSVDYDLANLNIAGPENASPRTVRIMTADTLTAAYVLTHPYKYDNHEQKSPKKGANVCVLNMASPLRPGGGVLTGATSQEEFLCVRTTLLPSLNEAFYRLPELGGIWSPDVLVFRNSLPLGDTRGELGIGDRYWLDVISAGMLRFPELEGEGDETKRLSKSDRTTVENKMRAVLRITARKGIKKLVLGAWGCGAYGNPVSDIAQAWKKILDGTSSLINRMGKMPTEAETWPHLEEVIFAISNRKMATDFAKAFDSKIVVEPSPTVALEHSNEEDEGDPNAEELRTKIQEMESQLSEVWNPDLKARMGTILDGLKLQLREREGCTPENGSVGAEKSDGDADVDDRPAYARLGSESADDDAGDEEGEDDNEEYGKI